MPLFTIKPLFLKTPYHHEDALQVQIRIQNQRDTLARALLHDGAPLTNNQAERDVRPMVIKRKISGGSRSWRGANATATNTSVITTIKKQRLPLFDTLLGYLLGKVE
jgi:transposase